MRVLVTGATGYIGGRLIPLLVEQGHKVRVLARDPERVAGRPWSRQVKIYPGNLLNHYTLDPSLEDVEVAYYLVHSLGNEVDFRFVDRLAADNFVDAAQHIGHVVYLGALQPARPSPPLASRAQVGEILRAGLPTTELRAGPILGSGSACYERLRELARRLLRPQGHPLQPIGVEDVLRYLVRALDGRGRGVVELGAEPATVGEMLGELDEKPGLRFWGSSIPRALTAPLLEGLSQPVLADLERARQLFPEILPADFRTVLRQAHTAEAPTTWRSALGSNYRVDRDESDGLCREQYSLIVRVKPEKLYRVFFRVGSKTPVELLPGERLGIWRIETVEPGRSLKLRSTRRAPGRAWLEIQAVPEWDASRLVMTAIMEPHGPAGHLYWWIFFRWGFQQMAHTLARAALKE